MSARWLCNPFLHLFCLWWLHSGMIIMTLFKSRSCEAPYAIWFLEWEIVLRFQLFGIFSGWYCSWACGYYFNTVVLCCWGVFNDLGKSNLILNIPEEFVIIIRDLVINTSFKWNILIYFLSCDFLYWYLKWGANRLDETLRHMKKQWFVKRRKPAGLPPNGLTLPWWCYHIPEFDLETCRLRNLNLNLSALSD